MPSAVNLGRTMDPTSPFDLMETHAATLFAYREDGRLEYVREPGDPFPPPRFFMGRTLQGNVWHFRHDLPDETTHVLERLCRSEPVPERLTLPPYGAAAIRDALQAHAPITREERGPAYRIPEVSTPTGVLRITKENGHLLQRGFPGLLRRILAGVDVGPVVCVVARGTAVSTCFCARLSPLAAEAGVETLNAMRGRGYATAAVSGWAAAVRERGLLPLYSTTWDNSASQRIAHKLGMTLYGEDWSIE
jgi:hypothetical protein